MADALSTEVTTETSKLCEAVVGLQIRTNEEFGKAGQWLMDIKKLKRKITDFFEEPIRKAHEAHKSIKGAEKKALGDLTGAESTVNVTMKGWLDEVDRRVQEANREREWQAQRETKQREDQRIKAAAEAESMGNHTLANHIVSEAGAPELMGVKTPVVVSVPDVPKVEGMQTRDNWKVRITDLKALCAAVGAGNLPVEYVTTNLTPLNALARSRREKGPLCAGVECFNDTVLASV